MLQGARAEAAPGAEAGLIKETTTAAFRQDVIAESARQPVLVDFWAPWCGPCRQLTPVIEKVVKAAGGKVKLVKMNIDEHPQIAGQLGIQSIPAVIAFQRGQPIDGFMGAQAESQVKGFVERLIGPIGPGAIDETLAAAEASAAAGDLGGAAELYAGVLAEDSANAPALGGLIKLYVEMDMLDQAAQLLATVPADKAADPAIAGAAAALAVAQQAAAVGDLGGLLAQVAANPLDHQARFDLAVALNGKGRHEEAMDHLLEIVRRDRTWNDDGARKQLLQLFEAWGPMDELSIAGRRKLSTLLFS